MSLFVDKNHRRKSPIAIAGFFATVLFLCVYFYEKASFGAGHGTGDADGRGRPGHRADARPFGQT